MDQKATASLMEDMKRFFSFVQDINKALSKRIGHAAKLQEFVGISRELHDKSVQSIDLDLKNNLSFGELCSGILNTAVLLNINILRQKEIITNLKISQLIDKKIEKRLMYKILILSESVQKSLRLIQGILDNNNEMILLDNQLMNRRKLLRPKVDEFSALLKKIQDFINSDLREYNTGAKQKSAAEDLLLGVAGIFESMDREGLLKLTESIRNESRDEEQLSSKLSLRMDTVDQLHQKGLELFRDSSAIKNLLEIKDSHYRNNSEDSAQLSVILSHEISGQGKIKEIFDSSQHAPAIEEETHRQCSDLAVLYEVAGSTVENLIKLNSDMIQIFETNATREDQLIELSNMDMRCFENIRNEIDSIVTILRFIADVSKKNFDIGYKIDKNLMKLMNVPVV